MNHDYAHCIDYNGNCPKSCFRGELVRDLNARPYFHSVSYMSFKDTEECPLTKEKAVIRKGLQKTKETNETI